MTKTVVIDPVTRIEGHAKISIFLDDGGKWMTCVFMWSSIAVSRNSARDGRCGRWRELLPEFAAFAPLVTYFVPPKLVIKF